MVLHLDVRLTDESIFPQSAASRTRWPWVGWFMMMMTMMTKKMMMMVMMLMIIVIHTITNLNINTNNYTNNNSISYSVTLSWLVGGRWYARLHLPGCGFSHSFRKLVVDSHQIISKMFVKLGDGWNGEDWREVVRKYNYCHITSDRLCLNIHLYLLDASPCIIWRTYLTSYTRPLSVSWI